MDSIEEDVCNIKKHEFIYELPMAAKSLVGVGPQRCRLAFCEVRFRMDEARDAARGGVSPGGLHESAI